MAGGLNRFFVGGAFRGVRARLGSSYDCLIDTGLLTYRTRTREFRVA